MPNNDDYPIINPYQTKSPFEGFNDAQPLNPVLPVVTSASNPYASNVSTLFENIAHRKPTQAEIDKYSFSLATNGGDYSKVTNEIISSDAVQKVVNPIVVAFQVLTGDLPTDKQIDDLVSKVNTSFKTNDPGFLKGIYRSVYGELVASKELSISANNPLGDIFSRLDTYFNSNLDTMVKGQLETVYNPLIQFGLVPAESLFADFMPLISDNFGYGPLNFRNAKIDFSSLLKSYNLDSADGNYAQAGSLLQYTPVIKSSGPSYKIFVIDIGSDGSISNFNNPWGNGIFHADGDVWTGNFTVVSGFRSGYDKIKFSLNGVTVVSPQGNTYVAAGDNLNYSYQNGVANSGDVYLAKGAYSNNDFTASYNNGGSTILYYDVNGVDKAIVLTGVTDFKPSTDLINA